MKYQTHLVLISAQSVPNITPILDERFRPDRVVMLVSPDMRARADDLERIYQPRGVKVQRWFVDDAWDVEHIRNRVMELLTEYEQDDIVLNATGGTKPMSIAAYEVFRTFDKAIFYVHPEADRLIWMHPGDRDTVDLADKIKIKEYLQSYGAVAVDSYQGGVSAELRELAGQLARNIEVFSDALGSLNFYAAKADNRECLSPEVKMDGRHDFWKLIDLFEHAGLADKQGCRLRFRDEDARFIANGGWLESYAYACCLNIKKSRNLQDVGQSVVVEKANNVKNELDVALLKDNRLHILECKTSQLSAKSPGGPKADQMLYKLGSIRDNLAGLQARSMLVSANPLKDAHLQRARELKIETCSHRELQFLEEKLGEWIKK
ncbi:DUF1887 family CARF protein [Methylomarinum sp. Ch1-1]|uniref:DUF1887 family CARF protein n=1 Tax=Methylomarinum roseum TaxID=3067653 RepID=A0AAU7NQ10_9GAMM|nr:DUF1887 family CARF protein [Methylomarinum sp. Ch1-1]MDP4521008.1 DUF1887 family CARF protein [Methylomarinum sp. Ch1-1]